MTSSQPPGSSGQPLSTPRQPAGSPPSSAALRHRGRWLATGAAIGFLLTVVWSAPFVDTTVGKNVAGALLGDSAEAPGAGLLAGAFFALATGLAGSLTACNIAALGAIGPLLSAGTRTRDRLRRALVPLSWLAAGMLAVSLLYGAAVGIFGTRMPQFSQVKRVPGEVPPVLVQSMIVFGLVGACMIYLALAAVELVPDPFARISRRFPSAPMVFIGVLIGTFLIGRPFPLFRAMFRDAAERDDPLFGAFAFGLQSIGNIIILAILFLALILILSSRAGASLVAHPERLVAVTAIGLSAAGVFMVLYWDVRLLAVLDVIPWYPLAPWV